MVFLETRIAFTVGQRIQNLTFCLFFFVLSALSGYFQLLTMSRFIRLILGDTYVNMTIDNITSGKPMGVYNQGRRMGDVFADYDEQYPGVFIAFAFGLFFRPELCGSFSRTG